MKLPRIYDHFKQGEIFTIDDARHKLGTTGNTLRKRLSELAARNYICQIRQGLYRLKNIEDTRLTHDTPPFALASKLAPYCYIGFKSALFLHAKQIPHINDTIYVASPTKFNQFKYEAKTYFWCLTLEKEGVEKYILNHDGLEYEVLATNFEKTITDCLKRPSHCPSFSQLIELCEKIDFCPDLDKIMAYLSQCQVQSLFNRAGLLFEKQKERWSVPASIFQTLESKMSRKCVEWPIHIGSGIQRGGPQQNVTHASLIEGKSRWKIQFYDRTV